MVRKNRFIPHYSEDELAALQLDGIRWTIAHALAQMVPENNWLT